jgi:hypothetical protein
VYKANKKGFRLSSSRFDNKSVKYFSYYGFSSLLLLYIYSFLNKRLTIENWIFFVCLGLVATGFVVLFLIQRNRVKSKKSDLLLFRESNVSKVGLLLLYDFYDEGIIDSGHLKKIEREIHLVASAEDSNYFSLKIQDRIQEENIIKELFYDEIIGLIILFEYLFRNKLRLNKLKFREFLFEKFEIPHELKRSLEVYLDYPNELYHDNNLVKGLLSIVQLKESDSHFCIYDKETFKKMKSRGYDFSKGDQKLVRHFYQDYYHQVWRGYKEWKRNK